MGYDLTEWKAAAAAGTPPEKPTLFKEYLPDQIKAEGDRKYTFAISTGAVDRERDTLAVEGWDLTNYRKSPVVLWAHDYSSLPIGRAESVVARTGQLVARMEVVPAEVYPFAETVRQLVDGGFLKATSVGFRPLEWVFNEDRGGFDFKRQELLEFSVVPVPANPEALIEARHSGISLVPLKDWAIRVLDTYALSDQEKAEAARVLKIATGEPAAVTVAGAPEPDGAPHATEQPGDEPGPAILSEKTLALETKAGRVLSAANEGRLTQCRDLLNQVLEQVGEPAEVQEDAATVTHTRERRLVVLPSPQQPPVYTIHPETLTQAVREATRAEVRRLRGRLD